MALPRLRSIPPLLVSGALVCLGSGPPRAAEAVQFEDGRVLEVERVESRGGTLVLAEQNQSLLEGWIDRIVKVHGGQIVGIVPGVGSGDGGTPDGNGQEVSE